MPIPAALLPLLTGAGSGASSAMSPATSLLSLPQLALQAGVGLSQNKQANEIARSLVYPTRRVPQSLLDAVGGARLNAMDTRLPGESMAREQLLTGQAGANQAILNAGGGSAERLAALVGSGANTSSALNNLALMGAQQQSQDQAVLNSLLTQQANEENANWEWNVQNKYVTAAQKAEELKDAARKNMYSVLKGLGGAAQMSLKPPTAQAGQGGGLASGLSSFSSRVSNPFQTPAPQMDYTPIPETPPIQDGLVYKRGGLY